jgi:hypothetical protein
MTSHHPEPFEPASTDNKRIADAIEAEVHVPVSIEEEMMLEAAELEEAEYGDQAQA